MKGSLPLAQILSSLAQIVGPKGQPQQNFVYDVGRESKWFSEINKKYNPRIARFIPCFMLICVVEDQDLSLPPRAPFMPDTQAEPVCGFRYD